MAAATKPARRTLDYRTFDDLLADLDRLQAAGYDKAGNWDLAQACGHLADWMSYPVDGYPRIPPLVRPVLWVLRNTVVPRMARKALQTRTLPTGSPTTPESVPPPGGDEAAAVARLRDVIARFRDHPGEYLPSPLFGPADRETVRQIQLIHSAHHLSFLVPRD